jgi:hypothetical protein
VISLRRAAVAALAALAITWPGMLSARAQAQSREGSARTSPSDSYLAARHAGGRRSARSNSISDDRRKFNQQIIDIIMVNS